MKSRKQIGQLFSAGKTIVAFPLKAIYAWQQDAEETVQAGVTTSSRQFKKAVDRNRVKRILREAYRLNKPVLIESLQQKEKKLIIFFIFLGKELPVFEEVNDKMKYVLGKLVKEVVKISADETTATGT
nr:ribonuclease P protein component [Aridibaculum aurantiacum]